MGGKLQLELVIGRGEDARTQARTTSPFIWLDMPIKGVLARLDKEARRLISDVAAPMRSDFSPSYCTDERITQPMVARLSQRGYADITVLSPWSGLPLTFWLQEYASLVLLAAAIQRLWGAVCLATTGSAFSHLPAEPPAVLYPEHEWKERKAAMRTQRRYVVASNSFEVDDYRERPNPWKGQAAERLLYELGEHPVFAWSLRKKDTGRDPMLASAAYLHGFLSHGVYGTP